MAVLEFPPVERADEHGLLAVGGDLEVSSLIKAYTQGIFPWPISTDLPLAWFSPDPRGILCYSDLKLSSSLKKFIKQTNFKVSFNQNFEKVIKHCSSIPRKNDSETWITPEIVEAYIDLHYAGHAYSIEVKNGNELVGGLYGVNIGNYVSGESMFYKQSNASKLALISLMEHLNKNQIDWLDTQMVTPVVETLGGKEITRSEFLAKLQLAKAGPYNAQLFLNE